MPIIDIKFENDGDRYTYSPLKATNVRQAIFNWKGYIRKHFKTPCKIIDIKVTKLRTEQ